MRADVTCELERSDDGFGFGSPTRGAYYTAANGYGAATENTKVWLQPPYDIVLQAIAHYSHSRFVALLRLDSSTEWFEELHAVSELILIPRRDRIEFDPPPGVKASANPFPHGFYYRRGDDASEAILSLCYEWKVS